MVRMLTLRQKNSASIENNFPEATAAGGGEKLKASDQTAQAFHGIFVDRGELRFGKICRFAVKHALVREFCREARII